MAKGELIILKMRFSDFRKMVLQKKMILEKRTLLYNIKVVNIRDEIYK